MIRKSFSFHYHTILNCLNPVSTIRSLGNRGLKGTMLKAVRMASILLDRVMVGPEVIRINPVGIACNHRCPMCVIQIMKPDEHAIMKRLERNRLGLEHYVELFDSLRISLNEVNVTGGGEPLLHPDILDIIRHIKKNNLRGTLISNGTMLHEDLAYELVKVKWDKTRISIHGGDPDTYRRIHGMDNFDILVENISNFNRIRHEQNAKHHCELEAFHVIQSGNVDSIDKLFEISEIIGADKITFDPIISLDGGTWMTPGELQKAQDALRVCAKESRIPCNLEEIVHQLQAEKVTEQENRHFRPAKWCSVSYDQTFINSIGDVLPCSYSIEVMGNLKEKSFDQIWKGREYSDFRKRLGNGYFSEFCIRHRCTHAGVLHN